MIECQRTEDSLNVGRRYRFEHLALPTVLRDMYFSRGASAGMTKEGAGMTKKLP